MERNINYNLMLSLKDICLRRVAIILCTHPRTVASFHLYGYTEMAAEEDVKELELPPSLVEQLSHLVKTILAEIKRWVSFHAQYVKIRYDKLNVHICLLCWTNLGSIDYRKSAVRLIRYEMFDDIQCYKLACLYCLDDCIRIFWEQLSEENKSHFYKGFTHGTEPPLEFCWPHVLKGEETRLNKVLERLLGNPTTFNRYGFEYSAIKGNRAATEYFFQKLTHDEREALLFITTQAIVIVKSRRNYILNSVDFSPECYSNTFCYLLSLMSTERQMEIFKEEPFKVLMIFLDWPWRDLFSDIVELIWPLLAADEYTAALQNISGKIVPDFNFSKLFQKLFLQGSNDFRKHFINDECVNGVSFSSLFEIQDSETIKVIFRGVEPEDRKRLVHSPIFINYFYTSILRGKSRNVELCVKEVALSDEDRNILKNMFFKFMMKKENYDRHRQRKYRTQLNLLSFLGNEEEQKENSSASKTDSELDASFINRRKNIWEQFLYIVDKEIPFTRHLDEKEMYCLLTDEDNFIDEDSDDEAFYCKLLHSLK